MNLQEQFFIKFKKEIQLSLPANYKLIIAISGGVDSVVLADLLFKNGIDFCFAHCNFKLRNNESERDEVFVRKLAIKYSKEFFVKQFETEKFATENKISIQVAARNLRYDWFSDLQKSIENKASYILTAHHKNDTIETVLFNFFRGTGISGLTGIKTFDKERKIIRPLLNFTKEEIINYAKENKLDFVEDSSNELNKYSRNFFRNKVLPLVKENIFNVETNIFNNSSKLKEAEILYHQAIEIHKKILVEKFENDFKISILKLKKTNPINTIIWEIIKEFGFSADQVFEIKKLLNSQSGSYVASSTYRIINNRKWLIISPLNNLNSQNIIIENNSENIEFKNGRISIGKIKNINIKIETEPNVAMLDGALLEFPLILRKWKMGDYFYPFGMQKKQKLSKFFINQKLSIIQKENVWVIESNKKIIWVVGYRIDNRFSLNKNTAELVKFIYLK